jgi:hypothetical protein
MFAQYITPLRLIKTSFRAHRSTSQVHELVEQQPRVESPALQLPWDAFPEASRWMVVDVLFDGSIMDS